MQMGARVYLPAVGRFLQVDPVDGGSANAYDYALQNPVNMQDLTGQCVPICIAAAVLVGEIVFVTATATFATGVVYVATRDGALQSWRDMIEGFTSPITFAKGGKQNVRHSDLGHMDASEIKAALRNPNTPRSTRRKLYKELKGRGLQQKQRRKGR